MWPGFPHAGTFDLPACLVEGTEIPGLLVAAL